MVERENRRIVAASPRLAHSCLAPVDFCQLTITTNRSLSRQFVLSVCLSALSVNVMQHKKLYVACWQLWLVHTADADKTTIIETGSRRDKTVLSRRIGGVNKPLTTFYKPVSISFCYVAVRRLGGRWYSRDAQR